MITFTYTVYIIPFFENIVKIYLPTKEEMRGKKIILLVIKQAL